MNWVKSEPSADNVNQVGTKVLNAALKWTKTQKNFSSLPNEDQSLLIGQSINELFILQMAENNFSLNEAVFFDEDNQEKKQLVQEFQKTLNKFAEFKVDLMEFYLLKSIILFKSDYSDLQDKQRVESVQEECFNTLFNYNKLSYPGSARFGRLLVLFTDVKQFTNKVIDDSFMKKLLGKNDLTSVLQNQF